MKRTMLSNWKVLSVFALLTGLVVATDVTEAPTGFDTLTNGAVDQATHDADRGQFEEPVTPAKGLGPLYNATSCVDCHQNPVTGGNSQVSEMRAGHLEHGVFVNPEGGVSLVHDRATSRQIQQRNRPRAGATTHNRARPSGRVAAPPRVTPPAERSVLSHPCGV